MSKLHFSFILLCSILLISCSDSKEDDFIDDNKTYKVRYEGSSSIPNAKLRVMYTLRNTNVENVEKDVIEEFVTSPFSKEITMKKGEYYYLSVSTDHRGENPINENEVFTSNIYVDGKIKAEAKDNPIAIASFVLLELK